MARVSKEEKYPNGSLKSRETELHGQPGQRVILKESWYPPQVDPLNPWQATDAAQQRSGQQKYKLNYVNGQQHGVQEGWYENGQQWYKQNYVNGQQHGVQEARYENGQQWYKLNYLDGIKVSQQAYQSYVEGLEPEVQATTDFEEHSLSRIIAMYLLP